MSVFTAIWFILSKLTFSEPIWRISGRPWRGMGVSSEELWMPRQGLHLIWIISTLDLSPAAGPVSARAVAFRKPGPSQSVARSGRSGPGWAGLDRPLENTICPSDSAVTTVTVEGYYAGSEVARLSGIALQYWAVRQQHSDTRDLSHGTSRSYNLARELKSPDKTGKL